MRNLLAFCDSAYSQLYLDDSIQVDLRLASRRYWSSVPSCVRSRNRLLYWVRLTTWAATMAGADLEYVAEASLSHACLWDQGGQS